MLLILQTKKYQNFPFPFLADVKDSGAGSYRTSIACLNSYMMKLISEKKRVDYFALTQIFIDINEFGICNVQPLSGSA